MYIFIILNVPFLNSNRLCVFILIDKQDYIMDVVHFYIMQLAVRVLNFIWQESKCQFFHES